MTRNVKRFCLILLNILFISAVYSQTQYSLYKEKGKYGIIDYNRKIKVKAEFDEIIQNEKFLCKTKDNGSYLYDENCKLLYSFNKDQEVVLCSPDFCGLTEGEPWASKYYLLNIKDGTKKECRGHFVKGNNSDSWFACDYQYFSKDLKEAKEAGSYPYPFRNNRAVVLRYAWKTVIIDENFNELKDDVLASAETFSEGLLPVIFENGESGYINEDCKFVHKNNFYVEHWHEIKNIQISKVFGSFSEGMAVVQTDENVWEIFDRNFNTYEFPDNCVKEGDSFSNGLLLVSKKINEKTVYGFLNKKCQIEIPFDYSYAESFFGNYAIVQKENIDGVIDDTGKFYKITDFKQ